MKKILVTGATGQIGSELVPALRARYGSDVIVAAGHKREAPSEISGGGSYYALDVRNRENIDRILKDEEIGTVYHLAALLSARGESDPLLTWEVNMGGLTNVLEAARTYGCSVFSPSSIGAFGPSTPAENTPQDTIQRPATMYGITKVAGELLCDYYHRHYGMDTRGLRFPGLISNITKPGGGTTDYAVEIFYSAVSGEPYTCFLGASTRLDMMYMPDAIRAAIMLMEADSESLIHRNSFNVSAINFTPEELYAAIKSRLPAFNMTYKVDPLRQEIADSWPKRVDDSAARSEWGWKEEYDLDAMVDDMLEKLSGRRV